MGYGGYLMCIAIYGVEGKVYPKDATYARLVIGCRAYGAASYSKLLKVLHLP